MERERKKKDRVCLGYILASPVLLLSSLSDALVRHIKAPEMALDALPSLLAKPNQPRKQVVAVCNPRKFELFFFRLALLRFQP